MNAFVLPLLMGMPAGAGEGGGSNPIMSFLPLIAIIAIFYFLILRPQRKKQQENQKMLSTLKKGDRIITIGGVHGIISTVKESTVIVKVDDNVKLEINRSAIGSVTSLPAAREEKEEEKEEKSTEASGTEEK